MNQKGFIKDVVIIVIGIIILAGGYFYFSKKSAHAPAETTSQNQITTTNPADTADWKTYRNEKYGFGFKYPPNYKVSLLRGGEVGMSLESDYAFIDFVDSQRPDSSEIRSVIMNGMEVLESGVGGNMDGGIDYEVLFKNTRTRNGYLGIIFSTNKRGYESKIEEFRRIIPTFKFTK